MYSVLCDIENSLQANYIYIFLFDNPFLNGPNLMTKSLSIHVNHFVLELQQHNGIIIITIITMMAI